MKLSNCETITISKVQLHLFFYKEWKLILAKYIRTSISRLLNNSKQYINIVMTNCFTNYAITLILQLFCCGRVVKASFS